ncbi:MAG: hypothetical protein EOP22_19045 [Hyphomicrobiales bacterium]|nr:MAG: hypothetical protein EOP22_19045 [Hyphomicrobiales bacterium]
MRRTLGTLVSGFALTLTLAAPAMAQSPLRFWIDVYHGQCADCPHKPVTFHVELADMDKVNTLCSSDTNLMRTVAHIQREDMVIKFGHVSHAACVRDKSGNVKIAAGDSSVGSN